jgi:hypothetical protein
VKVSSVDVSRMNKNFSGKKKFFKLALPSEKKGLKTRKLNKELFSQKVKRVFEQSLKEWVKVDINKPFLKSLSLSQSQ